MTVGSVRGQGGRGLFLETGAGWGPGTLSAWGGGWWARAGHIPARSPAIYIKLNQEQSAEAAEMRGICMIWFLFLNVN